MFVYFYPAVSFVLLFFSSVVKAATVQSPISGNSYDSGQLLIVQVTDPTNSPYTFSMSCTYGPAVSPQSAIFNVPIPFSIPSASRGDCFMQFNQGAIIFATVPFKVYTTYFLSSATGSSTALAGSNFPYIALTIPPSTPVSVETEITCEQGSPFSATINLNANGYSIPIPLTVSGACQAQPSTATTNQFYSSSPYNFFVENPVYMTIVSGSPAPTESTITLLINTIDYTPVTLTLTFTCSFGGSQSMEVTSASGPDDYYFYKIPTFMSGDCLFTQSNVPPPYQATTAPVRVVIDWKLYYFPMMEVVDWRRVARDARRRRQLRRRT